MERKKKANYNEILIHCGFRVVWREGDSKSVVKFAAVEGGKKGWKF